MPSNVPPTHEFTRKCAVAALLCAAMAGAQPVMALQAPLYGASIDIRPDRYDPDQVTLVGASSSGQSPLMTLSPATYRLTHTSMLGTGTIGTASSGPENGGTVRATASTADERIGSWATLNYEFILTPKAGVVLPSTLPLHVLALGGTGTDGYGSGSVSFILNYRTAPQSWQSIYATTSTSSDVSGNVVTNGGNGQINIDQWINVAPNTAISVSMSAKAGAGTDIAGRDDLKNQYGTGSAWVDPVFTLPTEWLGLVDIVGVPMASTVPEPSAWAMALTAAGLGLVLSRRRSIRHQTT